MPTTRWRLNNALPPLPAPITMTAATPLVKIESNANGNGPTAVSHCLPCQTGRSADAQARKLTELVHLAVIIPSDSVVEMEHLFQPTLQQNRIPSTMEPPPRDWHASPTSQPTLRSACAGGAGGNGGKVGIGAMVGKGGKGANGGKGASGDDGPGAGIGPMGGMGGSSAGAGIGLPLSSQTAPNPVQALP